MSARDHFLDRFTEVHASLPGAELPWMRRARERMIERFAELGLPTTRVEDWKYTSVAAIERQAFEVSPAPAPLDAELSRVVARYALDGAFRLVFVDGHYAEAASSLRHLPDGLHLESLAQAIVTSPWRLEAEFDDEAHAGDAANGFTALNGAFWADGAHVEVAPGLEVERPVHLLFVATQAGRASFPHSLVRVGAGASVDIVEHFVGLDGGAYLTAGVTRVTLGEGARVALTKLQQEGDHGFHVAERRVVQSRASRFMSRAFAFGARLARDELATRLDEGCEANLAGLYVGGGRQHHDQHTSIDHAAPGATSREAYKGILDGAARAVFNGRVVVREGAQLTDAQQSNHNLLLSDEAEVDTKPQLEIWADDVRCAHGATVGQLDADQLHYLRARGIGEIEARGMLIHAFAADVVRAVELPALRARIEGLLPGALPEALGEPECEMPKTR